MKTVSILPILVCFCVWCSTIASAHEFETGYIQRSMDVVVRGREMEVRYAIGVNDETILNLLAENGCIDSEDELRLRSMIALHQKQTDASDTTESDQEISPPLEFQSELVNRLADDYGKVLSDKLTLRANGEVLAAESVAVQKSPRQHVAVEIVLKVEMPEVGKVDLVVEDGNFLQTSQSAESDVNQKPRSRATATTSGKDNQSTAVRAGVPEREFVYSGSVRLACRAKGSAVLLRSTVAPLLIRAEPSNVDSMDLEQRLAASRIETTIGFAGSSD